jgi:hypothetical protein
MDVDADVDVEAHNGADIKAAKETGAQPEASIVVRERQRGTPMHLSRGEAIPFSEKPQGRFAYQDLAIGLLRTGIHLNRSFVIHVIRIQLQEIPKLGLPIPTCFQQIIWRLEISTSQITLAGMAGSVGLVTGENTDGSGS